MSSQQTTLTLKPRQQAVRTEWVKRSHSCHRLESCMGQHLSPSQPIPWLQSPSLPHPHSF